MPRLCILTAFMLLCTLPPTIALSAEPVTVPAGNGWAACPAQNRKYITPGCVHDGDTFWFSGSKYRLACINAAELSAPNGPKARDLLISILNRPNTTITDIGRQDPYHRELALVSGADSEMLGQGLATDPDYRDARKFCQKK